MPVVELAANAPMQDRVLADRLSTHGSALAPVRLCLFLAVFAWHVQVVVDLRCVFFAQNDLFLANYRFLHDFLVVPGGVAQWLGKLALQACYGGWLGTVVLTAIAGLVCIATVGYLTSLSRTGARVAWALPAIVLLGAHSQYDYPFSTSIGAALAMWAAFGYVRAVARWARWRWVIFAGLCLLLYYVAGAALYVYVLCAAIFEFYARGSRLAILSLLAVVVVAKCIVDGILSTVHPGLLFIYVPSSHPFRELLALSAASVACYASFPVCALALADRAAHAGRANHLPAGLRDAEDGRPRSALFGTQFRSVAVTVLFLVTAVLVGQCTLSRNLRTVLRVHDSADRERWDDVLRWAKCVRPAMYSQFVTHDVNQALYHTGRLPYDMFSYPQPSEPFVLFTGIDPYDLCRRRIADFHLLLGRVNDAEFHADESFVANPSAHSLRQLARIAIVKGRVELARLLLNVLRDDLVYGVWADDYLRKLQEDPTCAGDTDILRIRSLMITDDNLHYATAPLTPALLTVSDTGQLSHLVRRNPLNRMAFEYTMARYLVIRNVETVVQLLPQATSLAYPTMPPLYEEAAMIFARAYPERAEISDTGIVVNGCRISDQTVGKVRKLDASLGPGPADPAEISRAAGEVGLEYFRYYYGQGDSW